MSEVPPPLEDTEVVPPPLEDGREELSPCAVPRMESPPTVVTAPCRALPRGHVLGRLGATSHDTPDRTSSCVCHMLL